MRHLFVIILPTLLCYCSSNKKQIKYYTEKEYATRMEAGKLVKDILKTERSIGFYPNGKQNFFVGLVGYNNHDTSRYNESDHVTKTDGNKKFIYDDKGKLLFVAEKKGDTTFNYNGENLKEPTGYTISNSKNQITQEADYLLQELLTYKNCQFDQHDNLTYAVVEKDYLPGEYELTHLSDIELSKRKIEAKETTIIEKINIYY